MNNQQDENESPIAQKWSRQMSPHLGPTHGCCAHWHIEGGMPWCPIPLSACRKGVKVSLLSGVSVCWQGPRFSAALGCLTPSTGKPHSCHSSLGYNQIQKRWHRALCSCWACKVSGSPELPYLLCPTGYIVTRLARAWLLVLPLHPFSGWAALRNPVSSSDRKSKGVSAA